MSKRQQRVEALFHYLRPLTVKRIRFDIASGFSQIKYIGVMQIYVFGICVAKIQLTNPW